MKSMRNDLTLEKWKISKHNGAFNDDFIESVFFSGNGRMGARGYPSISHGAPPHKTGIFIAGVFGELKKGITDFVNLPTPFYFSLKANGVSPETEPRDVSYTLDLHGGLITIEYGLKFGSKVIKAKEERFFSLENTALACERVTLTADADLNLEIASGIRTGCCNNPINDDQTKENSDTVSLIKICGSTFKKDSVAGEFKTLGTDIKVKETVFFKTVNAEIADGLETDAFCGFKIVSNAKANEPVIIEKSAVILTSRDVDARINGEIPEKDFEILYEKNLITWKKLWKYINIELIGNARQDAALRYVNFELIANDSAQDKTVSIGARGLTHTRYKGCYFWDTDFFMLPFYLLENPKAAKNLMEYRAGTLPQAKAHAKKMNGEGARFPWMSSFDGTEQCESWDIGASEVHITADVVFAMDNYIQKTGDSDFYKNKAAEIYIETARFYKSRYSPEEGTGKVNLLFCKGPDEYCGITENNLFTNVLVKKNLDLAAAAAEFLKENDPEKYKELNLSDEETESFKAFKNAIKIPKDENGHYRQDDTFSLLEPTDIKKLKNGSLASYKTVCFDRVQRCRVIKQADVILLMTRFKDKFTKEERMAAWNDFEPVCLHDSTLSFATHALFAAQNGIKDAARDYFNKALFLDLQNIMENTGTEGLHTANLGETWSTVVFGFAGLEFLGGEPKFSPHLPDDITEIDFNFFFRGKNYKAAVKKNSFTVALN